MTGAFKDIVGSDRGINVAADILTRTVDGVDLNTIWAEFQDALALANDARNVIARALTYDITESSDLLALDGGTAEFEKVSEFGLPKSNRATPNFYRVGFPLEWFDMANRFTRQFLRDATREQVDGQHAAAIEADNRLLFNKTLSTLTTKLVAGSRPLNEVGVPIYSLYSGSPDDKPPTFANKSFAPGHNHYLVSGGAVIDGVDLADLIKHITEHGFGVEGGERIVIMVNTAEGDVIRGFRAGQGSPASPWDFIPSESAPAYLTDETIIGDKPPKAFNGLPIIGSFGNALIHESLFIPAGYVIATSTAGRGSSRNPLAFRQHPSKESQGLRQIPGNPRYPLVESIYEHGFGLGVRNRGAAAVMQIKASGTYDSPSWN